MSFQQNFGAHGYGSNKSWRYDQREASTASGWHNPGPSFQQVGYNPAYPSYDSSAYQSSQFFASSARQERGGPPFGYSSAYKPTRIDLTPSNNSGNKRFQRNQGNNRIAKVRNPGINKGSSVQKKVKKEVVTPRKAPTKKDTRKMPNYQGLNNKSAPGWGGNWTGSSGYGQNGEAQFSANRGGNSGGRGRGGGRGGYKNRIPRAQNSKDDIPIVPLTDKDETIELPVSIDKIVAFHGFDSVFTSRHNYPILVDGKIYESPDHYYQIRKVADLVGEVPAKLNATIRNESGKHLDDFAKTDGKPWSLIAKEAIKGANIEKDKINQWRNTKGLEAMQVALSAKVSQSAQLRAALTESGDSILAHAYAGDSIYGTGCTVPKIKTWLEALEKSGTKMFKVPAIFPLTEETVKTAPVFANGRNILGVILMQLRKQLKENKIEVMDMTTIFNALRVTSGTEQTTKKTGFQIGGGDMQQKIGTF